MENFKSCATKSQCLLKSLPTEKVLEKDNLQNIQTLKMSVYTSNTQLEKIMKNTSYKGVMKI